MRVVLVDDEALARQRLSRLIGELGTAQVVGEAASGEEALAVVDREAPDVLFVDVRMPGLDGLSLAARYASLPPIVFVTAHDEFAVRAFEVNAVDYLLKPVRRERLALAIERAEARVASSHRALAAIAERAGAATPRVISQQRGVTRLFDAREIARFWASEKYTVFVAEGGEHLTCESLLELEERLASHGFARVHRGELVNLRMVKAVHAGVGGHEIELSDGQRAKVSRRLLGSLRAALGLG